MSADPTIPTADASAAARSAIRSAADRAASRLPPLLVEARRVAETVAQGVHGRRRAGAGAPFWQYRPYTAGEAAQRIDWRRSGRGDELFVRETEWEAAQTVYLWVDRSASMGWTGDPKRPLKGTRAAVLALALADLLIRAGERVALLGAAGPRRSIGNRAGLERLAHDLTTPPADEAAGRLPALPIPRHATLVLIGDYLDGPEAYAAPLRAQADRGVHGVLLQLLDPAEETLPYQGRIRFEGVEQALREMLPRVELVRDVYAARLLAERARLTRLAREAGLGFQLHLTDQPATAALLALHQALAGAAPTGRAPAPAA